VRTTPGRLSSPSRYWKKSQVAATSGAGRLRSRPGSPPAT
jgi:hypothetical protein